MDVQKILHACTANIYRDFSNQQISQKMLKVALPIIAFLAISYAAFRCIYPNQPRSKPVPPKSTPDTPKATTSAAVEPKSLLTDLIHRDLYNGVCAGYENHADLHKQSHRWSHPTNQETLVHLSTGGVYPANLLEFPESHTSYIMAEPPKNSEFVQWQTDFYRMVIEKNVSLVFCTDMADAIAENSFLQIGETLKIDQYTIECTNFGSLQAKTGQFFKTDKLTISHPNINTKKTIYQFIPVKGVGELPINMIQGVMDSINDNIIIMDETNPLLVTCRTGFGSSARFILFHELQERIEVFTRERAGLGKEKIYQAFMAGRSIPQMLQQLALEIQELSTSKAAVDAIKERDLFSIEVMTDADKSYKDFILATIEKASRK